MCKMAESSEAIAVGIDLGTTNSCVAIARDGTVDIIEDEHGNKTMPSMFTYVDHSTTLIGWESLHQAHMYPHSTVYEAKRLIGQNFDNKEIQKFKSHCGYEIINDDNLIQIRLGDIEFYLEEITARILEKLKEVAEDFTGKKATRAVITVPAYFVDTQREATIDAAHLAGFESVDTINEPTAAALAFQHNNPKDTKRNILIYDFGGGTFDVTVAEVEKRNCNVLATKGDCFLGGTDIDMNIAAYVKLNATIPIHENDNRMQRRLKNVSENAKKRLSSHDTHEIDSFGSEILITKEIFEDINNSLFDKTIKIAKDCIEDARLKLKDIDEVVLIGGSTRIPKLQEMIKEAFGCHIAKTINPDEAVAYGAALYAANKFGNSEEINVKEVLSLSLGIETVLGEMHFLLKRNTSIPCEHVEFFNILSPQFMIRVYQGESLFVKNNHYLGECIINDLHQSTTISIKFSFDKDAILTVSAQGNNQVELKIDMTKHKLGEEQENILKTYEENRGSESKTFEFIRKKREFDFYCENLKGRLENHHRRRQILENINAFKKKIAKFSQNNINEIDEYINKINEFMNSLEESFNKPKTNIFQRLSSLKF